MVDHHQLDVFNLPEVFEPEVSVALSHALLSVASHHTDLGVCYSDRTHDGVGGVAQRVEGDVALLPHRLWYANLFERLVEALLDVRLAHGRIECFPIEDQVGSTSTADHLLEHVVDVLGDGQVSDTPTLGFLEPIVLLP